MSSPSTRLKVNRLCIRCLCFGGVRGDLQECHYYTSQCHFPLFPSTKMPILCSKCPKTGVPKAKKAQKPRFCARNARKWGFRRPKKHKNLDFVLEMPENEGLEGQKRTKTSILCSGREGIGIGKHNRRDAYRKLGLPANHRARFKNSNTS